MESLAERKPTLHLHAYVSIHMIFDSSHLQKYLCNINYLSEAGSLSVIMSPSLQQHLYHLVNIEHWCLKVSVYIPNVLVLLQLFQGAFAKTAQITSCFRV
jgi:hypothetical protein